MDWRAEYRDFRHEYSKGESVWGREQHYLVATCNPNWQLVRTPSVCQSFWLLLVVCPRGKPQHAEQSATHAPTPPEHPQQLVPQPRSLLPAAVFAARSPSTNFHIVCLQLWAHQSNSTLFIRVCADKQTALYTYIYLFMYCSSHKEVVLTFLMFIALTLLNIYNKWENYVCMNIYI